MHQGETFFEAPTPEPVITRNHDNALNAVSTIFSIITSNEVREGFLMENTVVDGKETLSQNECCLREMSIIYGNRLTELKDHFQPMLSRLKHKIDLLKYLEEKQYSVSENREMVIEALKYFQLDKLFDEFIMQGLVEKETIDVSDTETEERYVLDLTHFTYEIKTIVFRSESVIKKIKQTIANDIIELAKNALSTAVTFDTIVAFDFTLRMMSDVNIRSEIATAISTNLRDVTFTQSSSEHRDYIGDNLEIFGHSVRGVIRDLSQNDVSLETLNNEAEEYFSALIILLTQVSIYQTGGFDNLKSIAIKHANI